MKRLSWFASVIALALGMGTLYLGRLAAERGIAPRVARGRWATAEDRASFTAGYERGYKELLASRAISDKPVRQAE